MQEGKKPPAKPRKGDPGQPLAGKASSARPKPVQKGRAAADSRQDATKLDTVLAASPAIPLGTALRMRDVACQSPHMQPGNFSLLI